jgi:hypothetical protein
VEAHAKLAKAEGAQGLLARIHRLHGLYGDGRAVRDAGTETGRGGAIPGGQART